jgi:hypothetical protein
MCHFSVNKWSWELFLFQVSVQDQTIAPRELIVFD